MQVEQIRAVISTKSSEHPELRAPLTLQGLRRVLARERIAWLVRRHPRPAQLVPFLGQWSIVVDVRTPVAQYTICGAHELGHLWLHHDPHFDRWETRVYEHGGGWDSEHEADAERFAELLVRGPEKPVSPPLPPKRKRGNNAVTAQLPIDFNEPQGLDRVARGLPPIAKVERKPFVERPLATSREYERGVVRRGAPKVSAKSSSWITARPVSDRRTDDEERITWHDEEKHATRFTDAAGMRWWSYNYCVSGGTKTLVGDFMSPSITHRLFVNAAGVGRVYRFPDVLEQRAYRVKHLDRQLAQAHQLPRTANKLSTTVVEKTRKD
jgi:hypothetical protein